jgi:DNA-binding XRE family transcriptional regulator
MALQSHEIATVAISSDERAFFIDLGARIARLRKDEGITQVQLAEQLGTSQQTITAYEVGRRRVPVSSLPRIASCLACRSRN